MCALCRRGLVGGSVAACRYVSDNHIGGELPAQYSALTSLQVWCVAPNRPGCVPSGQWRRLRWAVVHQPAWRGPSVNIGWHRHRRKRGVRRGRWYCQGAPCWVAGGRGLAAVSSTAWPVRGVVARALSARTVWSERGCAQGCFGEPHRRRAAGAVLGAHQPASVVRCPKPTWLRSERSIAAVALRLLLNCSQCSE